jgi:hypothetical protein
MRYTPPVLAASLVATVAVFACSESDNPTNPTMTPSSGETGSLVGCIGANESYPEPRVFLESQGWWGERKADGTVPRYGNAEHIHVGMCFPLRQTVSDTVTLKVRVQGHRLKRNSVIRSTTLHDPATGGPDGIGLATINWDYTNLVDNGSFDSTRTVKIPTKQRLPDGLREFRNLTRLARSDGDEIHASSGWCWKINNTTQPDTADSGTCDNNANYTQGRGWYSCFEYKIAEVRNWAAAGAPEKLYPWNGIPAGQNYSISIGARDGAGPLDNKTFDGWEVRLDPNFHAGDKGYLVKSGSTPATGVTATIPGDSLTPGLHKLVILAFADTNCSITAKGEMTGVLSVSLDVN